MIHAWRDPTNRLTSKITPYKEQLKFTPQREYLCIIPYATFSRSMQWPSSLPTSNSSAPL